jgi:hypothetical protein
LIVEFEDAIYLTERYTCRSKGKDSKMVFDCRTRQFALTPWLLRSQFKESSASR